MRSLFQIETWLFSYFSLKYLALLFHAECVVSNTEGGATDP